MLLEPDEAGARLDDAGVAALLAAAHGEPVSPEATVTLATGRFDPVVTVLADPLVSLELVVAGESVRLVHRGWVTGDLAVLLAGVHAGDPRAGQPAEWRLLTMAPDMLTAGLVRLTRMRPRRDLAAPLTGTWHDDLVSADAGVRAAARASLGAAQGASPNAAPNPAPGTPQGAGFAWRLHAAWAGGERLLRAVDGPSGLHLADPRTGELRRATTTYCYRVLSTLLPTDAELAEEPAAG